LHSDTRNTVFFFLDEPLYGSLFSARSAFSTAREFFDKCLRYSQDQQRAEVIKSVAWRSDRKMAIRGAQADRSPRPLQCRAEAQKAVRRFARSFR